MYYDGNAATFEDVDDETDSEDGDVFAFLPPQTPEPTFDPAARYADTYRLHSLASTSMKRLSLTPDRPSFAADKRYSIDDDESREGSIKMEFDLDAIEEEDSPFPEVRASVSNVDDPDMPTLTIRMWFVGLISCLISRQVF